MTENPIPSGAELLRQFRKIIPDVSASVAVLAGSGPKALAGEALASLLRRGGCRCTVADVSTGVPADAVPPDADVLVDAAAGLCGPALPHDVLVSVARLAASFRGTVVSLEVPSGLGAMPDASVPEQDTVAADATIVFGRPPLSLLLPENGNSAGRLYVARMSCPSSGYTYLDEDCYADVISSCPAFRTRKFAHKGDNGHALLVCGSSGMAGAAVLSAAGALRSGCGLVTVHLPREERMAVHIACPSAMVSCDPSSCFSVLPADMGRYTAVGAGCGLGTSGQTVSALGELLGCNVRLLLDADALNVVASHRDFLGKIPQGTVLTPHIGEFRRLAGNWSGWQERLSLAAGIARELRSVLVLKGAHTMVVSPSGQLYFNSTGTPAMAKGGSGDVLAGLTTGLLARGADPLSAALAGVYRHGLAGEKAELLRGTEQANSGDIVQCL